MSDPTAESTRLSGLRRRAADFLGGPVAGQGGPGGMAVALATLHALASSPETAPDALALLHELQVHQVELDLQAQDLLESRVELEGALRRHAERYEAQPVGCFTIDAGLVARELNRTGEAMLGVEPGAGVGADLGGFFTARSRRTLQDWVARALADGSALGGRLQLNRSTGDADVIANLRGQPADERCLVVLTDCAAA